MIYETLREAIDAHATTEQAAQALAQDAPALLLAHRAHMAEFNASILDRWQPALDGLELLLMACLATGIEFDERHGAAAQAENDPRVAALRQLWSSSCLVGGEALALLRGGFASGAFARWRTLYEIGVTALFVGAHDRDTAEALWEHTHMQGIKVRHEYQRWANEVGEELLSPEEMRAWGKATGDLIGRHGEQFKGDHGWAHQALLDDDTYARLVQEGKRRRGPLFPDLEASLGLRHERVWFGLASRSVHARLGDSEAVFPESGSLPYELHPVPSASGLALPGGHVARSLWAPTAAFVLSYPSGEAPDEEFSDAADLLIALSHGAEVAFASDEE